MNAIEQAREALAGLLDGLDANADDKGGLTQPEWDDRVSRARTALCALDNAPMSVEEFAAEARKIAGEMFVEAGVRIRRSKSRYYISTSNFGDDEVRGDTITECLDALRRAMEEKP